MDYQGGGLPAVQNSNRIELERARTSFDRTHVFVVSGVWRIDYLKDKAARSPRRCSTTGRCRRIVHAAERPAAHDHVRGQDRNLDGVAGDRADIVGDPKLDTAGREAELIESGSTRRPSRSPPLGADGTAGRNIVDGPGYTQRRPRPVPRHPPRAEASMLQLRAEATNVFNTVNLLEPGHGPERARDLRQDPHRAATCGRIQLGARLSF